MTATIINLDDHRTPTPAVMKQLAKSLKGKSWKHICPMKRPPYNVMETNPAGTCCGYCGRCQDDTQAAR